MNLPSNMSWLLDDAIVIGIPLISLVIAALIHPAYLALRGDWRSWTVAWPVTKTEWRRPTSYLPFTLICSALVLFTVMPSLVFEALGWEEARKFVWAVPLLIPMVPLMISLAWWPPFLGPAWYRRWRAAAGTRNVLPWTSADIAAAAALPEGRRKKRILGNIEVSKGFVQVALAGSARGM